MRRHSQTKIQHNSSNPNFWDQLNQDIETIGLRAKDNLRKYQIKQYHTIKPRTSREKYSLHRNPQNSQQRNFVKGDSSLFVGRKALIQMKKEEEQKERQMKNRLAYLQVGKNKQAKTIEIAKKKFQNLVTIRKQSIKQKQALRKRKMSLKQEDMLQKQSRIHLVQTARQQKNHKLSNYKQDTKICANRIRFESIQNHSLIQEQRQKIRLKNISKVHRTKSDLERSRSIVSQIKQRKRNYGHNNYLKDIGSKMKSLSTQKKKNEQMSAKFSRQLDRISQWKTKADKEINEYKSILKVGKSRNTPTQQSISRQNSVKSFYLTNY